METLKLKGNWNELKGKLKKSYAELTEYTSQVVTRLQEKWKMKKYRKIAGI